ncbi:hypothetical protein QE152_g35954 [Popillia japonica]|uniref:Uncharacterized protein n=1 Tax=Popillia japonica TaxID=7064 RepID=A0AAW1IEB6_POPJA
MAEQSNHDVQCSFRIVRSVQLPDNSNAASKYAMVVNLNGKIAAVQLPDNSNAASKYAMACPAADENGVEHVEDPQGLLHVAANGEAMGEPHVYCVARIFCVGFLVYSLPVDPDYPPKGSVP